MFNISYRKVGGLTFVKLGRLTFSFSVAPAYRDFNSTERSPKRRITNKQINQAYWDGIDEGRRLANLAQAER